MEKLRFIEHHILHILAVLNSQEHSKLSIACLVFSGRIWDKEAKPVFESSQFDPNILAYLNHHTFLQLPLPLVMETGWGNS